METKSLKLQMKQPWSYTLGLDFGHANLKYVLLKRKGNKVVIVKFGKISAGRLVEDTAEVRASLLRRFSNRNKKFGNPKIVLGIDGPDIHVKKESFPPLSKKDLFQTIKFDMEREVLKEIGGGEILFDFIYVGLDEVTAGNREYLTLGAPRLTVDEVMEPMVAENVIPAKISSQLITLGSLMKLKTGTEGQTIGLLDVGTNRSMFAIYKNGILDFYREIPVGGDDFTNTITGTIFHEGRAIQFTTEEALQFKMEYGYPIGFTEGMTFRGAPLSEIGAMMRPMVERLTSEIHRSIDFYREKTSDSSLDELLLIGGGARLKHLPDMLSEKIDMPVHALAAPKNIHVMGGKRMKDSFSQHFLEHAVSLSLAFEDSSDGSLLPPSYRKINRIGLIQQITRYAALFMFSVIIFMSMYIQGRVKSLNYQLNSLRVQTSTAGDRAQQFKLLETKKDVIKNKISLIDQKLQCDDTSIQLLKLFSHIIPDHITIVNLSYEQQKAPVQNSRDRRKVKEEEPIQVSYVVQVEGESQKPPVDVRVFLGQLMVDMKRSGYFKDVSLVREAYNSEENKYEFSLVAPLIGNE